MDTCGSPEIANRPNASVSVVSGHEPVREHPLAAGRMLPIGGDRLGLVGAIPAPADAGAPTRVPGPGADVFVAALIRAIRIARPRPATSTALGSAEAHKRSGGPPSYSRDDSNRGG